MWVFEQWRQRRILKQSDIDDILWSSVTSQLPLLHRFTTAEMKRLRVLVQLFLHDKVIEPVQGLMLDEAGRLRIAILACLPILKLDFSWYDGWVELVIYPDDFINSHGDVDEAGLVHSEHNVLSGEAWSQGPVILSWTSILAAGQGRGHNVVIHEMAHKLDMLNGAANGFPPLHARMKQQAWSDAFAAAYEDLSRRVANGGHSEINSYAATNPAECFAVCSEYFFDAPELLLHHYPDVYRQLSLFYRQEPARR